MSTLSKYLDGARKRRDTTRVRVTCPKCGATFEVEVPVKVKILVRRQNPKGSGAHYSGRIVRLSPVHKIIAWLVWNRPKKYELRDGRFIEGLTKRDLERMLAEVGVKVSGNALSGRLSELGGRDLRILRFVRQKVKLCDPETQEWRFENTPVWTIDSRMTERGRQLFEAVVNSSLEELLTEYRRRVS